MKAIVRTILLSTIIFFTSCEEFLERPPLHGADEATFWKTTEDGQIALNALYRFLPNSRRWWTECYSDNAIMTNAWGEGGLGQIKQGDISPTTGHLQASYGWSEWRYDHIRPILYFLEQIQQIETDDVAILDDLEGQGRFILAMKYFRMSRLWGDLPLVTKPLTAEESELLVRSTQKEIFAYILENLDRSIELLADTHDKSGKISKDAGLFLKTEVLMWMASLDQYHGRSISDLSSTQLWRQAANTIGMVVKKDRYQLHPDLIELFQSQTNNTDNETILARQYMEDEVTNMINLLSMPGGVSVRGGGWASFSAPRNLVDDYEVTDGKEIRESTLYDFKKPFENRDKRLTSWFLLPGVDVVRRDGSKTPFDSHPDNGNREAVGGEGGGGRSGYWGVKYGEFESPDGFGFQNWIIYRYGEALLLLAESLNECDAANDSISWAMNQVRDRAELPGVDDLQGNPVEMRKKIWHERRVELVNEEKRYYDLLRWKQAEVAMNPEGGVLYGINQSLEAYTDSLGHWDAVKLVAEPISFDASRGYLWPVPQSVIDRNENISQNPGW